jgi:hypothetical protein
VFILGPVSMAVNTVDHSLYLGSLNIHQVISSARFSGFSVFIAQLLVCPMRTAGVVDVVYANIVT